jgi:hypothetical protein
MLTPKDHRNRFDPSRESLAEMAALNRRFRQRSMTFAACGAQFSAQDGGEEGAARAFDQPSSAGGVQPDLRGAQFSILRAAEGSLGSS